MSCVRGGYIQSNFGAHPPAPNIPYHNCSKCEQHNLWLCFMTQCLIISVFMVFHLSFELFHQPYNISFCSEFNLRHEEAAIFSARSKEAAKNINITELRFTLHRPPYLQKIMIEK
jgi:hypothetical protein